MATSGGSEGLTEIGLLFTEEGYDSLLDKIKTVGQEVNKLAKEDELRVTAAAKVAKATAQLSDQIDRSIVSYAGSKSELLQYKAAQLGLTEALAGQLAMLREMETHAQHQKEAFKDRQQDLRNLKGLESDRIKDMLANIKVEEDARKQAAKMAKGLEEDRIKDIRYAVEQEIKLREEATSRYVKSIQESFKAYQRAKEDSKKLDAEVLANLNKANEQAIALAEKQAMQEIAWANKSAKERIAILQQVAQYQAHGGISPETITNKFGAAAVNDLPNLTAHQAAYNKELAATGKAHEKLQEHQKSIKQLWSEVTFTTSRARSEMIVLAHEAVQGRFSRIPASMMVMAEYSNLSALAMSGLGAALLGAAIAGAGLIVFAFKGQEEMRRLNTALLTTSNYSGLTTSNFYAMADAMTKSHGSIGEAKEALMLLTESGRFTKEQIDKIAPAVMEMAHASGKDVERLVKDFEKLSKAPTETSKALTEQQHYLSAAVYEQIAALERQGEKRAAADLAEAEFAKASKERAEQIRTQLGWFSEGWEAVTRKISQAKAALESIGRPATIAEQLTAAIEEREKYVKAGTTVAGGKPSGAYAEKIKEQNAIIFKLMRQAEAQEFDAAEKSDKARVQLDGIQGAKRMEEIRRQNQTQEDHRNERESKLLQSSSAVNIAALEAAGVKVYELDKILVKRRLDADAGLGEIVKAERERSKAIIEFAKQRGIKLVETEEEIAKNVRNIAEKKRDRPVEEVSFVGLSKKVQDEEREFQAAVQHSERMIGQKNKQYLSTRNLADDELAVAKDNANTKSAIQLAELDVYSAYINKIKAANELLAKEQTAQLDAQIAAGKVKTDAIVKEAEAQVAKTADGEKRKAAVIKEAQDAQQALVTARKDRVQGITDRSADNIAEAESKAYKQSVVEVNHLVDAVNKRLQQKEKELAAIGMTKSRAKELALLEEQASADKIRNQLAQDTMMLQSGNLSQVEIDMYTVRIAKLEEVYKKTLRILEINAEMEKGQDDWRAGAEAGFQNYLENVENVFESARKATEKAFKGMEDILVTFVTTGKLNFNSFVNSVVSDIARIVIRQQALPAIMGALGLAGSANASTTAGGVSGASGVASLGSLASGASNMLGLTGFMGSGFGAGLTTGFSSLMAGNIGGGLATAAGLAETGALAGSIGTLAGVLGPIALGVFALSSIFGGEKNKQQNTGNATSFFAADGTQTGQDTFFGGSSANADKIINGLQSTYTKSAIALGIGTVATAFNFGSNVRKDGSDPNFALGGYAGTSSFQQGETTFSDSAVELAAGRAVLAALQGSELPKYLQGAFDGIKVGELSQDEIKTWYEAASAVKSLHDQLQTAPWDGLKDLSFAVVKSMSVYSGGIEQFAASLGSFYQSFYTEGERTAALSRATAQAFADIGIAMPVADDGMRLWYRGVLEAAFALDQSVPANAKAAAEILKLNQAVNTLAPEFENLERTATQIRDSLKALRDTGVDLAIELMKAQGDLAGAATAQRAKDTKGFTTAEVVQYDVNAALRVEIENTTKLMELRKTGSELAIEMLRAQGNEEAALREERAAAIVGMNDLAVAQYDSNEAIRASIKAMADNKKLITDALSLLSRYYELNGDAVGAATVRQRQQLEALKELSPALRAIQRAIWDLEATATTSAARLAVANAFKSIQDTAINAAKALKGAQDQITGGYLSAQDAVTAAQEGVANAAKQATEKLRNFSKSIKDFLTEVSTTDLGANSKAQQFANLKADFAITSAQASAGDEEAMGDLVKKATSLLSAGKDQFSTSAEFGIFTASVVGTMARLKEAADAGAGPEAKVDPMVKAQKDLAEAQADLVAWTAAAAESGASLLKVQVDYAVDWRKANADNIKAQRDLVDAQIATNGIDLQLVSVLGSLRDLIATYNTAKNISNPDTGFVGPLAPGGAQDPGPQQRDLIADAAIVQPRKNVILDYAKWLDSQPMDPTTKIQTLASTAKANGVSEAEIADVYGLTAAETRRYFAGVGVPQFADGTNYVPADTLAMIHEGEAIVPKAYNPAANNNAILVAEIQALRGTVTQLLASSERGNVVAAKSAMNGLAVPLVVQVMDRNGVIA